MNKQLVLLKYCFSKKVFLTLCLSVWMVCSSCALAEDDTSIYFNASSGQKPNILFLIDNSLSMNNPLHEAPEDYNFETSYASQPLVNNTVFDRDNLYFTTDNQNFKQVPIRHNTCQSLTQQQGFVTSGFVGLLAYDEPKAQADEGWKPYATDDKQYEYVISSTTETTNSCNWKKTPAADAYDRRGDHRVQLDRIRVWHSLEFIWNNRTNSKVFLTIGRYVIYTKGDRLLQSDNVGHVQEWVCEDEYNTVEETETATGEWRAVDCSADNGVSGQDISSTAATYPKLNSGPDINQSTVSFAKDAADLSDWWQSSASPAPEYSQGTLAYGNYWNWWFGPGNEGEDIVKTRIQVAREAFAGIVGGMTEKRVGLMVLQGTEGGRVLYPVSDIDEANHKQNLIDELDDVELVFSTPLGEMLEEASRYLRGEGARYGKRVGGSGTFSDNKNGHPDAFSSDTTYKSPIQSACQKNHIILMTDGAPHGDMNHADSIEQYMKDRGQIYTSDYVCGKESSNSDYASYRTCMDKMALFLNREDLTAYPNQQDPMRGKQNAVVHTVAFDINNEDDGTPSANAQEAIDILETTASLGGGQSYSAFTAKSLTEVFQKIVDNVTDTPSSGAAPTVPISAASRFSNGDKVYVSLFKPAATRGWHGNLKSYHLEEAKIPFVSADGEALTKTVVTLVDVRSKTVIDPITKLTSEGVLSRWTNSTDADGDDVLVGGLRDHIPQSIPLFIDMSGTPTVIRTKEEFTSLIPRESMGVATDEEQEKILQWALSYPDSAKSGSAHSRFIADPLHNSPKVLAYKIGATRKEMLFMGTNIGFLHTIDTESGIEQSRWMPDDLLKNLKSYYYDEPIDDNKMYGLDGALGILHHDKNNDRMVSGNEKAILYVGMRRGGRNYYALDVSDYSNPKLLWKIKGGSGEFKDLGYTWSSMLVRRMRFKGEIKDVVIFSGGYDLAHDEQEPGYYNGYDNIGRGLYIVDALTGERLYSSGFRSPKFLHSISYNFLSASTPATPAVIDVTGDGLIDIIYTIDLAGNLMRYDVLNDIDSNNSESGLADFLPEPRRIAKLFDYDVGDTALSKQKREFFSQPTVVLTENNSGTGLSIVFGSGRRSSPRSLAVQDRFYVIRDNSLFVRTETPFTISNDDLSEVDLVNPSSQISTTSIVSDDTPESVFDVIVETGFYVNLGDIGSDREGEKVLGGASIIEGIAAFAAYLPDNTRDTARLCETLGLGANILYALDIETGETIQAFNIQQLGIFGDVGTLQYKGRVHVNVPVLDIDGNTTTMLATGGSVNAQGDISCPPGAVCGKRAPESFYKFWIERAF